MNGDKPSGNNGGSGIWRMLVGSSFGIAGTLAIGWVTLSGRYVTRDELDYTSRAEAIEVRAMLEMVKTVQIEQAKMGVKLDAINERLGRGVHDR